MPEIKTGKIEQACARYGLGRNTMRKVAGEAGAEIKIGKCYLINFSKVDAVIVKGVLPCVKPEDEQ